MKFAFISIPSQELERPPAAAAAISACVRKAGLECKVFDFNLYLNKQVDSATWIKLEEYWRCKTLELDSDIKNILELAIDSFIEQIKLYQPDWLGISIFSRMSVVPAFVLLKKFRETLNCKVVIGGNGSYAWAGSVSGLSTTTAGNFAEYALEQNLIDYYIHGDGEDSIIELLNGNVTYAGINGIPSKQIRNLSEIPMPEYDGIEPNNYFYTHEPGIYITASRGCVRKCTFCNVPTIWPKFATRSADHVVKEIIDNKRKYGVNLFQFTDSLINGDMKSWRQVNQQLIEAKRTDSTLQSIKYMGQFICRTRLEQTESDWQLMSQAGAELLVVGFESFSPRVRRHMGKYYSNDDIDFHLKQSAYYGIKNVALMFVGYPIETLEDHEYNIEFLHRYQKYAKSGTLSMVRWGYTGMFGGDVSKVEKSGEVKIIIDPNFVKKFSSLPAGIRDIASGFGWLNELNPDLTLSERIRRRLELHEVSVKLGYPLTRSREELQILYNILSNLKSNTLDVGNFEQLENILDFH
jgi:hypothetical protein